MKLTLMLLLSLASGPAWASPTQEPGTITDRRTGDTIELTCLNEECEQIHFRILDQNQVVLADSGPRSVSWMMEEINPIPGVIDGTRSAWVIGQLLDYSADGFSFLSVLLAPVGVAFDVVTLPGQTWHELVTIPVRKNKIRRALHGKHVQASHRSFQKIRELLAP